MGCGFCGGDPLPGGRVNFVDLGVEGVGADGCGAPDTPTSRLVRSQPDGQQTHHVVRFKGNKINLQYVLKWLCQ